MHPTWTVWTTLVEDHPGIISVKFGQNPMSGFRGEVFKEIVDAHMHAQTMNDGQGAITKAHLEHFVLRWAKKINSLIHKYTRMWITTCIEIIKETLLQHNKWQRKVNCNHNKATTGKPNLNTLILFSNKIIK